MKATDKDFRDTIHIIHWTVQHLEALGLPADKADAAEKYLKQVAATAVKDAQRASQLDTMNVFGA